MINIHIIEYPNNNHPYAFSCKFLSLRNLSLFILIQNIIAISKNENTIIHSIINKGSFKGPVIGKIL